MLNTCRNNKFSGQEIHIFASANSTSGLFNFNASFNFFKVKNQ